MRLFGTCQRFFLGESSERGVYGITVNVAPHEPPTEAFRSDCGCARADEWVTYMVARICQPLDQMT